MLLVAEWGVDRWARRDCSRIYDCCAVPCFFVGVSVRRLVVVASEDRALPVNVLLLVHTLNQASRSCVFRRPLLFWLGLVSGRTQVDPTVFHMLNEDPGGISFSEIGGLGEQIRELREVIELPLTNPELFIRVGIKPPKVCTFFFFSQACGPPRGRGVLLRLGLCRGCVRAHAAAKHVFPTLNLAPVLVLLCGSGVWLGAKMGGGGVENEKTLFGVRRYVVRYLEGKKHPRVLSACGA